jgi:hypothetical protein
MKWWIKFISANWFGIILGTVLGSAALGFLAGRLLGCG